ncbi:MAG TPA: C40 family peptidase [Actinocrinis sp.]|nr:C40 family peptidase [Actinocrinis sp.]
MRKPFEPDYGKASGLRGASIGHGSAGTMLVATLAIAVSFTTPPAANASVQHPHLHSVSRVSIHDARKHAANRETDAAPSVVAVRKSLGEIALAFAIAQLGKPYRYGASGPNAYDCSGLAQRAWRSAGVAIPRTTQAQARFGAQVPLSRIQLGDLVIFYASASHVGIYAGDGRVIVAPHAGKVVSYAAMRWMPIHTIRRPG